LAQLIPMPLMDAEQVHQQQHGVVLPESMPLAPISDGPLKFVVEVRLLGIGHNLLGWQEQFGDGFNLGVELALPSLETLPVEQAE